MSLPAFMLDPVEQYERIDEQPAAVDDAPAPAAPPFVPGVFYDMPAETYHAIEAMSASGAVKILKTPRHYRLMRDANAKRVESDVFRFGRAFHIGVLEPHRYNEAVVVAPDVNKRSNAGKAELAVFEELNAGRLILSPDEKRRAMGCARAVREHPSAAALLRDAKTEVSLFWIDGRYKVPCKARLDIWNRNIVGDLKTTRDASEAGFSRAIGEYSYHLQAAVYASGCEHVLDTSPDHFVFIPVESEEPFGCATYYLRPSAIAEGMNLADEAYARYARALESGRWDGYPDTIEPIDIPRYKYTRRG